MCARFNWSLSWIQVRRSATLDATDPLTVIVFLFSSTDWILVFIRLSNVIEMWCWSWTKLWRLCYIAILSESRGLDVLRSMFWVLAGHTARWAKVEATLYLFSGPFTRRSRLPDNSSRLPSQLWSYRALFPYDFQDSFSLGVFFKFLKEFYQGTYSPSKTTFNSTLKS